MLKALRRAVIGRPLESDKLSHERFNVPKGLAILSSDPLSSVAYAGEEILHVLVPLIGLLSLDLLTPISAAIALLLFIVTFSYKQIIDAHPKSSGGAYIVAKENLGVNPGLIAGAALLIDYLLTVAVSVSAGVAALTSAYQAAIPYRIEIGLVVIAILILMNLRGVTEAATVFSYPTYVFITGMFILLIGGFIKYFMGGTPSPPTNLPEVKTSISSMAFIWLILRAFSSGCAALTGVEAVSNAVPAFKEPENKHAKKVLTILSLLLFIMFVGLAILTKVYNIVPSHNMTVISQVALKVFGSGTLFYLFQASTGLILTLAANTAFSGFPMLASLMARDGFLPRYLSLRGDKLVFSNGIIILGFFAGLLVVLFKGETTRLIPLYAVGVFTSFTLSQSGMVRHWLTTKEKGWLRKLFINGVGALATGIVTLVIAVTKFEHGAWIVVILIPIMVFFFRTINKHYMDIRAELDFDNYQYREEVRHKIIVPVASLTNVVAHTIDYGKTLSDDIVAVHVSTDTATTVKLQKKWDLWNPGVELTVLQSPFRSTFNPLVDYILEADNNKSKNEVVTVLIPEFVTRQWWHRFLHNQTGLMLQNILVLKSDVVVTTIPYHLHK